jgi:hypothetical protein
MPVSEPEKYAEIKIKTPRMLRSNCVDILSKKNVSYEYNKNDS